MSYVEQLVQTKGEKFKDPEFIAKSKIESDDYIKQLEQQVKELREDLPKVDYSKQLLEELKKSKATDAGTSTAQTNGESSEADLPSLVNKAIEERETQATLQRNQSEVNSFLEQRHGTEAEAILKKKAGELGVTVERLKQIGGESPSAFKALLGEPDSKNTKMTSTSVRSEALLNSTNADRGFKYYQEMRKANKSTYFSAAVQQQMMRDRKALGEKFYN